MRNSNSVKSVTGILKKKTLFNKDNATIESVFKEIKTKYDFVNENEKDYLKPKSKSFSPEKKKVPAKVKKL